MIVEFIDKSMPNNTEENTAGSTNKRSQLDDDCKSSASKNVSEEVSVRACQED